MLVRVADALALVRFRRPYRPDIRGELADTLFVDAGDLDTIAALHLNGEVGRNLQLDRPRVAGVDDQRRALNLRAVPHPVDEKLPREPGRHPGHHVGDQVAGQTVHRPRGPFIVGSADCDRSVRDIDPHDSGQRRAERALGTGNVHLAVIHRHFDSRRHRNRQHSYA